MLILESPPNGICTQARNPMPHPTGQHNRKHFLQRTTRGPRRGYHGLVAPGSRTIVVVEDDEMMRLFLEEYLGQSYHVVAKTEGTEALAWLRDGQEATLVIADLAMPGMDGFAFIREVRADVTLQRLPVMVLSGSEKSEDRVTCLRLGADDFIVKPFNPEELMARVENLLRRLG